MSNHTPPHPSRTTYSVNPNSLSIAPLHNASTGQGVEMNRSAHHVYSPVQLHQQPANSIGYPSGNASGNQNHPYGAPAPYPTIDRGYGPAIAASPQLYGTQLVPVPFTNNSAFNDFTSSVTRTRQPSEATMMGRVNFGEHQYGGYQGGMTSMAHPRSNLINPTSPNSHYLGGDEGIPWQTYDWVQHRKSFNLRCADV